MKPGTLCRFNSSEPDVPALVEAKYNGEYCFQDKPGKLTIIFLVAELCVILKTNIAIAEIYSSTYQRDFWRDEQHSYDRKDRFIVHQILVGDRKYYIEERNLKPYQESMAEK